MGKCGPLKRVNLHRILEFAFRNISLDKHYLAYSTDSGINKLPKGILCWASGAECIERAERDLQKDALCSVGNMIATPRCVLCMQHAFFLGHQVLILFWTHLPCFFSILSVCMPGLFCSAAFWLVRIVYCGRLGQGRRKKSSYKAI